MDYLIAMLKTIAAIIAVVSIIAAPMIAIYLLIYTIFFNQRKIDSTRVESRKEN